MFTSKRLIVLVMIMVACSTLLISVQQLALAANQAVVLSSFTATPDINNTVRIEFATSSESDISHWLIKRSSSPTGFISTLAGNWMDDVISVTVSGLDITQIPATGGSTSGASYTVYDTDSGLNASETWWYTVVEVQASNGLPISHDDNFKDDALIGDVATFGVNLSSVSTGDGIAPGGSTTHVVRVQNTGSSEGTFRVHFGNDDPDGWTATVNGGSQTDLVLGANVSQTVDIVVTAPNPTSVKVSPLRLDVYNTSHITATDVLTVFSRIESTFYVPILIRP